MAGKTVISPNGTEFVGDDFVDNHLISFSLVFGEWQLQSQNDTVVFETIAELANESMFGSRRGLISDRSLYRLRNKKVRVTVEVLDE